MDSKKKESLKEKGWEVGDTKEFLGLTDEEVDAINKRLEKEKQKKGKAEC
jgi:hypothetical protein